MLFLAYDPLLTNRQLWVRYWTVLLLVFQKYEALWYDNDIA